MSQAIFHTCFSDGPEKARIGKVAGLARLVKQDRTMSPVRFCPESCLASASFTLSHKVFHMRAGTASARACTRPAGMPGRRRIVTTASAQGR
ncbi:MAG: hypothetical protein AB7E29_06910 [Xanthobacter sp.]